MAARSAPGSQPVSLPAALLDLLLPTVCVGCAEPGTSWCGRCRPRTGPPVRLGDRQLPPSYALADYRGAVRAALLGYKERGRRDLATALGEWLADGLEALPDGVRRGVTAPDGSWWLVPVPSRRRAAARRGGQHVAAVAHRAAAVLAARGRPVVVATALRMSRGARDSVGLDAAARRANLAGRVVFRPAAAPPPNTPVVLVDDIVTTGATAGACVAGLNLSSVEVGAFVALAAAGEHAGWQLRRTTGHGPRETGGSGSAGVAYVMGGR